MPTEIRVHLASRLLGDEPTPTLIIRAEEEMPEAVNAREHELALEREGRTLATALWDHLPGGVVDQVLCALLERRASKLRVKG
jgi:hypothetical protein